MALTSTLPTPSGQKTWALALWVLREQKLPPSILEHRSADIVKALEQALNEEKGHEATVDSLKVKPFHPSVYCCLQC